MADAAAPAPAPAPAATPAQASAEPALVLAGYLTKQGGAVKSWKKRYFTLKGTKLQYFKSAKDATELGVIDLSECDKLVESTVKPHGFEVHTPNRIFRVVADTNDDKEAWVLVIKPRIGTNRVSKDGDSSDEDEHEKFGEPMEIIQPPEGYADEARQSLSAAAVEPPAVAAVSAPADAATPAATSDAPSAVAEAPAAAPAEPVAKPTISGYLTKQGGAHKNWKRRYFALTGNELKYFKSEKDKNHLGFVDVSKSTAVLPAEVKGLDRTIAIVTPSRTYLFSAPSDTDYQAWLGALQPLVPVSVDDGAESDDETLDTKAEDAVTPSADDATTSKPANPDAPKAEETKADDGAATVSPGDVVAKADVIRQGFLTKQGGKQKTWKRRFFVLRGSDLQYFKNDKEKEAIGTIDLTKCSGISKIAAKGAKPNSFAIATPTRTYIIAAASSDEMEEWVHVLEDVVPEVDADGTDAADVAAEGGSTTAIDDKLDEMKRKLEVVTKEKEQLEAEKAEIEKKLKDAEAKLADLEKRFGSN